MPVCPSHGPCKNRLKCAALTLGATRQEPMELIFSIVRCIPPEGRCRLSPLRVTAGLERRSLHEIDALKTGAPAVFTAEALVWEDRRLPDFRADGCTASIYRILRTPVGLFRYAGTAAVGERR